MSIILKSEFALPGVLAHEQCSLVPRLSLSRMMRAWEQGYLPAVRLPLEQIKLPLGHNYMIVQIVSVPDPTNPSTDRF